MIDVNVQWPHSAKIINPLKTTCLIQDICSDLYTICILVDVWQCLLYYNDLISGSMTE